MLRRLGIGALRLAPAAFIAVFFGWPLLALGRRAVQVNDGTGIGELWRRTGAWHLLGFTLGQAALSAVVAIVVAIPIVWLVGRVDVPGASLLMVIVTIPFVLPSVVVGVVFRALLEGPLGFLDIRSGLWPILLAHAFLNVAVVVRIVGAAWRTLDPRPAEAARTLGASPARAFVGVVLPRLLPAIGAAAALVFLFCSTSFGVIIVLGNGEIRTLETEIYTQAIGYFRLPEAVALSMMQIVVVVAALLLTRIFADPGAGAPATSGGDTRRRPLGWQWPAVIGAVVWTVVLLAGPLVVLIIRSVRPTAQEWTLAGYRALGDSVNGVTPLATLRYSVGTAAVAMVIAVTVGLWAALAMRHARGPLSVIGNVVATIPLGVSAVTLGFGYLIALASAGPTIASSPLVIPCVQALIAIPVVVRIVVPALAAVPDRLRQAAATLGAGPIRVFCTVDLPMIARSLCAAAGFAFIMAFGEFGATGFLARADTTTMPVLIGSALNRPGAANLATAMAASTVMVGVTVLAIVVVELIRPRSGAASAGAGL